MPLGAKLNALRTRPYEPGELEHMGEEERKKYTQYYEKVISEDFVVEFESDNLESLGERLRQIAEANKARPIIIKTTNADELPLKHSFLIERSYVRDDERRMFEIIVFGPKNPAAWKEKMARAFRERRVEPASPSEQQEFRQKAARRMMAELEKTIMSAVSRPPEGLGFASMDEFRAFFEENRKKFANDREFSEFYEAEMRSRTEKARAIRREELVHKPLYYASRIPSMLNDEMTVHCRIVGKDEEVVYKHFDYYKGFHKLPEPVFVADNGADDGSHVSFVYGKNSGAQKAG